MNSLHVPISYHIQDAQEDDIRENGGNIPISLAVPLSDHTYTPPIRVQLPCEKYFTQILMNLNFIDPQTRVLNYF